MEITGDRLRFPALAAVLSKARSLPLCRDARVFQIVFLAALLTIGVLLRDFSLQPLQMILAFAAGLATQAFWLKRLGLQQKGFLSAIVTCCGLSLLLRSDALWAHPLAAILAMSSKYVLRVNGKHLYNPANLGVIGAITLLPGTWVSAGQWGSDLALAVWFLMLGTIVTQRARRLDVSWVFLSAFLSLVALRVAYALIVALGAAAWQYLLFKPNALIWALFLLTPLVPALDRFCPAEKFAWHPSPRPRTLGRGKRAVGA